MDFFLICKKCVKIRCLHSTTVTVSSTKFYMLWSLCAIPRCVKFKCTSIISGVFKISVRRGRGAIWVEGVGCSGSGWAPSPEKNHFCSQNEKFGCILTRFLTGRKREYLYYRSLWTRILRFNRETNLQKQCKNYPKIHGQTKGGGAVAQSPPPYLNTPLSIIYLRDASG